MFANLVGQLNSIPAPAWAVIGACVAGLVALVTTALNLAAARLTHRAQLNHAASESERQRQMALKRDIYLPALQAVTESLVSIASLADAETDHKAVAKKRADTAGALGAISLVASIPTTDAVSAYLRVLNKMYGELIFARTPIMVAHAGVLDAQEVADRTLLERRAVYAEQRRLRSEDLLDEAAERKIALQLAAINSTADFYSKYGREKNADQAEAAVGLLRILYAASPEISRLGTEATIHIRQEINTPTDADGYRAAAAAQAEASLEQLEQVIVQLDAYGKEIRAGHQP